MKRLRGWVIPTVLLLLAGCGGTLTAKIPAAGANAAVTTPEEAPVTIEAITKAFQMAGLTVEGGGQASFDEVFQGLRHDLKVAGAIVKVYTYENGKVPVTVSADGSTVTRQLNHGLSKATRIDWIKPPHAVQLRGAIVLVLSDDKAAVNGILQALAQLKK